MSVRKHRSYDAEFNKNAVLPTEDTDRTVADVADSFLTVSFKKPSRQQPNNKAYSSAC